MLSGKRHENFIVPLNLKIWVIFPRFIHLESLNGLEANASLGHEKEKTKEIISKFET